jgi:hypothetical protein
MRSRHQGTSLRDVTGRVFMGTALCGIYYNGVSKPGGKVRPARRADNLAAIY